MPFRPKGWLPLTAVAASLVLPACGLAAGAAGAKTSRSGPSFERNIAPLLSQYCFNCHGKGKHKGDVALDGWKDKVAVLADRKTWEKVLLKVQAREMPPENKPQPSTRERELLSAWIEKQVLHCDCDHPDPGRVTLRRLNRAEYNNTIRDLIGVDFQPADDFPIDDSGYGFDNIGDALSMPPMLMEKYLTAAQKVLDAAIILPQRERTEVKRYPVDLLEVGYNAKQRGDGWVALNSIEEDDVAATWTATTAGEYAVRVRTYARQDGANTIKLTFVRDKTPLKTIEVETNAGAPQVYEARLALTPGAHRLRAVVRRIKDGLSETEALKWKTGPQQKGAVMVEWLEVEGPLNGTTSGITETHRRIFFRPATPGREAEAAREILGRFARRAYRRPVTLLEVERLVRLAEAARRHCADSGSGNPGQGEGCFEEAIFVALQAILVSPHFLFRGELQPEPDNPKAEHPVNEFALASRLSYFLWSSMPDEELFALAERGKLRKHLDEQVRRMLQDPKARALVENFTGQWLQIRNVDLVEPDPKTFPDFDDGLRAAMKQETELFFDAILCEDRSILEFLTADWTFANERLARHYGIAGVSGEPLQRISLRGTPRRGVLTHASVLTLTSNPTRTSPVKRGKWVLENLLNAPPPPPPPNVPDLKEGRELTGSLRQRMEQHRADALCASCHARMDPIGFGLENFDGIGAWRTLDGGTPIEAGGNLTTGESFSGPTELIAVLSQHKQNQFVRCLADRMLTYALGRGLEYYDKCALDRICRELPKRGYKFSTLVLEIVKSAPFQMRRGDVGRTAGVE